MPRRMPRWKRIACAMALVLPILSIGGTAAHAGKLFLWEVTSKPTSVYLLGSIHLASPEIYPLDPTIQQAYARCSTLVVEADVDEVNDAALQALILEVGMYGEGRTLSESIAASTLESVKSHLSRRGLTMGMLDGMRPWMVAMTLSVMEMQAAGLDPAAGVDKHFLDRARADGKAIEQLESASWQIELFGSIPEPLQERFLVYTMEELDRVPEILETLMTAWGEGDDETLAALLLDSMGRERELEPLHRMLYADRNKSMTKKIRGYLERAEPTFVVVGAAHLVGDGGILDLLGRQRGLSIRQLAAAQPEPAAAD